MRYTFKRAEFVWLVLVAAAVAGLEVAVRFDPAAISDWRTWAIAAGAGIVRAAAGAALAYLTRPEHDVDGRG